MKKVVSVNLGNFGSTGGIMLGITDMARKAGYDAYNAYPGNTLNKPKKDGDIVLCSDFFRRVNQKLAYYTGLNGCFALISTYRFLRKLDKVDADILHFHNLHNSYINIPMLFKYVKRKKIKVVWTLHDCWSFTGKCPSFELAGCDKWKTECCSCPQYRAYPESRIDKTDKLFKKKKEWLLGVEDMTLVTPSAWLAGLVKQSFLKEYEVKVVNNGIDLSVFKPTDSELRKKLGLEGKAVLMGCAFPWSERKGLDVFLKLSETLDDSYRIVLVGVSEEQMAGLPDNIIGIERTANQSELAEYYSMADAFVNPTREENFPTVNIEALACGAPVITFDTGGSPEIIDETCGMITKTKDAAGILECIEAVKEKGFLREDCVKRAGMYDKKERFKEYVALYEESNQLNKKSDICKQTNI